MLSDYYGNIYPAHWIPNDWTNYIIKKYSSTWSWIYTLPIHSDCWIYYYTVNKWGYNYVFTSDCTTGFISKYDPDGNFLYSFDTNGYASSFISDDDDNLYAASGASLIRYDSSGALSLVIWQYDTYWQNNLSWTNALLNGLNSIVIHEGSIFLSTYSLSWTYIIHKYSSSWAFMMELWSSTTNGDNTLSWTWAQWGNGIEFFIDLYGNIIVNDVLNNKIKLYSWIDGTYVWTLWSGVIWDNEVSWTGASFWNSYYYLYQTPSKDAIFFSLYGDYKIKKYIP